MSTSQHNNKISKSTTPTQITPKEKELLPAVKEEKPLELKEKQEVFKLYMAGTSLNIISKQFDIPTSQIKHITNQLTPKIDTDSKIMEFTTKRTLGVQKAREERRKENIMESATDLAEKLMDDLSTDMNALSPLDKARVLTAIQKLIQNTDTALRLDRGEATANIKTETTTKTLNVTEILKDLKDDPDAMQELLVTGKLPSKYEQSITTTKDDNDSSVSGPATHESTQSTPNGENIVEHEDNA